MTIYCNGHHDNGFMWLYDAVKGVVCKVFGHRDVYGPRKGDGRMACGFCWVEIKAGKYDDLTEHEKTEQFLESEMNLK